MIKAAALYGDIRKYYNFQLSDVKLAELFGTRLQRKRIASGQVWLDYEIKGGYLRPNELLKYTDMYLTKAAPRWNEESLPTGGLLLDTITYRNGQPIILKPNEGFRNLRVSHPAEIESIEFLANEVCIAHLTADFHDISKDIPLIKTPWDAIWNSSNYIWPALDYVEPRIIMHARHSHIWTKLKRQEEFTYSVDIYRIEPIKSVAEHLVVLNETLNLVCTDDHIYDLTNKLNYPTTKLTVKFDPVCLADSVELILETPVSKETLQFVKDDNSNTLEFPLMPDIDHDTWRDLPNMSTATKILLKVHSKHAYEGIRLEQQYLNLVRIMSGMCGLAFSL
jgi:hypothetical protein